MVDQTFATDDAVTKYAEDNNLGPVNIIKLGKSNYEIRRKMPKSEQRQGTMGSSPAVKH